MNEPQAAMTQLEERFVAWARTRPDIRAAIVVGSWARTDHPADEWSDLDIAFSAADPQRYLSTADWLKDIGKPWLAYLDRDGVVHHVLFEGGLDAGFAVLPNSGIRQAVRFLPTLRRFPILLRVLPGRLGDQIRQDVASSADYYRRGVRVILDKDGLAAKFLSHFPADSQPHPQPTQPEFRDIVAEFWFRAVWTAKHLRRGELWWAKTEGCDGQMKSMLLRVLEWHAGATHGWDYDTWEGGRFLEEWADPRAVAGLRDVFAHYDENDIWRALLATMELFRWLAIETAERLGYPYPTPADERATQWIKTCLSVSAPTNPQTGA
jgi:aminoglycoside 6-adenylyltransferase